MKYNCIIKSIIALSILMTMNNVYAYDCGTSSTIYAEYKNNTGNQITVIENAGGTNQIKHKIDKGVTVISGAVCKPDSGKAFKNALLGKECHMNVTIPAYGDSTSDPGNEVTNCDKYKVSSSAYERGGDIIPIKYFTFDIKDQ